MRWRKPRPVARQGQQLFGTLTAVASPGAEIMGRDTQQWPWFAIRVRTGRERTATLLMENAGFECFLPVNKCTRRWSDRLKEFEVPLFPGYLFCRMNPHDRLPVLTTPGVIQIVGVGKTPIPVEEVEIEALQRVEKSGLPMAPWTYMEVGQQARIVNGPLRGMTGIVAKIKSGMKLVLSVSLLQRSVAVEVDRNWISDLSAASPAAVPAQAVRQIAVNASPSQVADM